MKRETDIIIAGTVCVLLFGLLSSFLISRKPVELTQTEWQGSWACAADTFACPDGTTVGRTPPYCLFAACATQ